MVGVGDQSLGMKNIATNKLANGHSEVGDQANSGDANASVIFVGRCQVYIVVMMVVVMMAVATMAPGWCHRERSYGAAPDKARSGMERYSGTGFVKRKGGEDTPLSRSTETGDSDEGVEGGTKCAPQGLRQRHHGLD